MAGGRPTKYTDKTAEQAYQIKRLGATDKQLAKGLGVSQRALKDWKDKYPEFLQSVRRGQEEYDTDRVENALLARALGYSHPEDKVFSFRGVTHSKRVTKHYPPDTGALALWLTNRRSDRWKNKHEHTGSEGGPIQIIISEQDAKL